MLSITTERWRRQGDIGLFSATWWPGSGFFAVSGVCAAEGGGKL